MACVAVCPSGSQQDHNGKHVMENARCQVCKRCLAECAYGALSLIGEEMSVADVLAEVRKDEPYYKRSGGGLTLSGGEPMSQFPFTHSLLRVAKESGLHTCLDTTGLARWKNLAKLLPLVDLFLFDYKATDPTEHRRLTGVSNERILENLDRLYRAGGNILLRCPLIPGINDSLTHLQGIVALGQRYPDLVGIEIMPYHNMGRDKAERIGQNAVLADLPSAGEEVKAHWLSALHELGCSRARLS